MSTTTTAIPAASVKIGGGLDFLSREARSSLMDDNDPAHRLLSFELQYSTKNWIDSIQEFTIPTTIFPISLEEARNLHKHCVLNNKLGYECDKKAAKESMDQTVMESLAKRLDRHISEHHPHGCFIKTALRSPKDAPFKTGPKNSTKAILAQELEGVEKFDHAGMLLAFQRTLTVALRASDASSALCLLGESGRSERDFKRVAKAAEDDEKIAEMALHLVLRSYSPVMAAYPMNEFRGFVKDGVLCALTQYNDLAMPKGTTLDNTADAARAVVEFSLGWKAPKDISTGAVVDFFCLPASFAADHALPDTGVVEVTNSVGKASQWRVWIIELNPFSDKTGGCLFDWRADRDVLYNTSPAVVESMNKKPERGVGAGQSSFYEFGHKGCCIRLVDTGKEKSFDIDSLMTMIPMEWLGAITSHLGYTDDDFRRSTKPAKKEKKGCVVM